MSVFEAVQVEVEALPLSLRESSDARLCLALAVAMDAAESGRETAVVSKELRAALVALRDVVGAAGDRGDGVDDLLARRAARRAASG